MAFLEIKNIKIVGFSACVPKENEENRTLTLFESEEEAEKFMTGTGVERRRVTEKHTVSDLCCEAGEKLIADLKWAKEDVGLLIFVSQTADHILPATSCILQDRLRLSQECHTLDITLGCSGWVYGLSVAVSLLRTGNIKKALLLCGDVSSGRSSKEDKSTYPLFGEAGTVTAIEFTGKSEDAFYFHFSTDGSGFDAIIVPDGRGRNPYSEKSFEMEEIEPGIKRNRTHVVLNGMDVFAFGISKAPESIRKLSDYFHLDLSNVDYFVFHQANKFMNEKIRKKLKLPEEKVPYSLKNFGNTSSASIPLTMVTELKEKLEKEKLSLIGCGFGVGLSWGTVAFQTDKIVVSDLVEI